MSESGRATFFFLLATIDRSSERARGRFGILEKRDHTGVLSWCEKEKTRESVVDSVVNVSWDSGVVMSGRSVSMFWLEFGQVGQKKPCGPFQAVGESFSVC